MSNRNHPGSILTQWITNRPLVSGLFFILAFLLYSNTIGHGYVLDDYLITKNKYVASGFSGIQDIISSPYSEGYNERTNESYRPITLISFAFEESLWKLDPTWSHLINTLLFAFSGALLFYLLSISFKNSSSLLPLFITLLFVAHPIHTEVVANIKSRDEILALLFLLLTLISLFEYGRKSNIGALVLALLFAFCSAASKESGIATFVIAPLFLFFFTPFSKLKLILSSILFAVLGAGYLLIRYSVLDTLTIEEELAIIDNSLVGAESIGDRLATAMSILGRYLLLLLAPIQLSWDYSFNQIPLVGWGNVSAICSTLAFVGLTVFALIKLPKKSPVSFGILVLLISLFPVSNLAILIKSTMAERFLYLPSLGFSIALVSALFWAANRWMSSKAAQAATVGLIVMISLGFSVKTIKRNTVWKDDLTLTRTDVKTVPNSARAHWALGAAFRQEAEKTELISRKATLLQQALKETLISIEIDSTYAEAHYNLGILYEMGGDLEKAKTAYKKAAILDKTELALDAINNLGSIYLKEGRLEEALNLFQRVYQVNENHLGAVINAGVTYMRLGNNGSALLYFNRAVAIDPTNTTVKFNIGSAFYNNQSFEDALSYFLQIPTSDPNYAQAMTSAGTIYLHAHKPNDAIRILELALAHVPNHIEMQKKLAIAYKNAGQEEKAQALAKKIFDAERRNKKAASENE